MVQTIQYSFPLEFNRYIAIASLQQLPVKTRLNFDQDTYVIRNDDHYIAYRNWMRIFPIVEVFTLGKEAEMVDWLEQHGYAFADQKPVEWSSKPEDPVG